MTPNEFADLCEAAGVEVTEYYNKHNACTYFGIETNNYEAGLFHSVGALFTEAQKIGMTDELTEVFRNATLHNPNAAMSQYNVIVFDIEWLDY